MHDVLIGSNFTKKSLEFSYKNLQTHIFQGLFSEFGLPFQLLCYVLILCYSSEQSYCSISELRIDYYPPLKNILSIDLLDLRQNKISSLKNLRTASIAIKTLALSNNYLEDLDVSEWTISDELILSNNSVENLAFVENMKSLPDHLDLTSNNIRGFNESLIEKLKTINRLSLSGNPWKCSCKKHERYLTFFLLDKEAIPCCPEQCVCSTEKIDKKHSVIINCKSRSMTKLPPCLPFDEVDLIYENNRKY